MNVSLTYSFSSSLVRIVCSTLLLVLIATSAFGQRDIISKDLIVDQANLLSSEEKQELQTLLENHQKENGYSVIFIRITDLSLSDNESSDYADSLLNDLRSQTAGDTRISLLYADVYRFSDDRISTSEEVRLDWLGLESKLSNPDDHYYSRSTGNLVAYRLQLKILFHYFLDEEYQKGFEKSVGIIEELLSEEIDSTDISPPFVDSIFFTVIIWIVGVLAFMFLLAYILNKLGIDLGPVNKFRIYTSSVPGFTASNTTNSYGGGDDGGYSGGGSGGAGGSSSGGSGFEGGDGSFGGGGASGDW